jgi:hypothetical protein
MAAAISSNVQQLGVPLGALVLSGAAQEWALTCVNRLSALVQFIAFDGSGNAVAFTYSDKVGGTYDTVPAGAGIVLPVYKIQSWFFIQAASAPGATLQASCQG